MSGEELFGSETEGDAAVRLVFVATVADNRIIGRDGDMSRYPPEDLRQFRRTTTGYLAVMDRKVYESIVRQLGGLLSKRHSVVLTARDLDLPEGTEAVEPVESAVAAAEDAADGVGIETACVAGGAIVYEQFPGRVAGLVLTELDTAHGGDTRFPEWGCRRWVETNHNDRGGFSFIAHERKQPTATDRGVEEFDE